MPESPIQNSQPTAAASRETASPSAQGLSPDRLERLVAIGIELSSQRHLDALLTQILEAAQDLTHADGGTIYLMRQQQLEFAIIRNNTLGINLGGRDGDALAHNPIPLYLPDGSPNRSTISASAAISGNTINIADAYATSDATSDFDFSGTRRFDALNGYQSRSFLTVPMKDHEANVIGVLQLINATNAAGDIVPFDRDDQYLVESLASQAAVVMTNRQLIERLEELFVAFIKLISNALDEKSPYTHGHCMRVPEITMLLADAVSRTEYGPLRDFRLTPKDRHELEIAALMHDCGKITTPVHVVDKATKLETIFDRIHLLDVRFEILKRDAQIRMLQARQGVGAGAGTNSAALQAAYAAECVELDAARDFLRKANVGGEYMSPEMQAQVREIGSRYTWQNAAGETVPLLNQEEADKLCIAKGTLSQEERDIINYHIVSTIHMLEALPWPCHLRNVPEYAGGHHERMDGKGYPKGLTREQMSVQARIMGIADIFEALTASDRPYKPGMSLSRSLAILGRMKLDNHIDPDLFDVFVREKVYLEYARLHLTPEQIDTVDESAIPGYFSGNVAAAT